MQEINIFRIMVFGPGSLYLDYLKKNLHSVEIMLIKLSFGQNTKQKGTALNSFTIVKRFTIKVAKDYTTFIRGTYIFVL